MSRRKSYTLPAAIANQSEKIQLDPLATQGETMSKLSALLKSRKFWAAVIGLGLIVARNLIPNFLPFGDQEITAVILVLISYILGTALEDAGAALAKR